MTFGEQLKTYRTGKKLSQEKVAELLGVSRQAVTKWENGQTMPSSENLVALSSLYGVSLDELAKDHASDRKGKTILRTNLTILAIIFQASALNVWIYLSPEAYPLPATGILLVKLALLAGSSAWMAHNLRYEKNPAQYGRNVKIELLYCSIQFMIAAAAFYSGLFPLGTAGLLAVCLFYIYIINPRYMNRPLVKYRKKRESRT